EGYEKLVRDNPSVTRYQSDLAINCLNLGVLQKAAGRPDDALASYKQAREIWDGLARRSPTVVEFRANLARLDGNIGVIQAQLDRDAEAEASFRRPLGTFWDGARSQLPSLA